LSKPNTSYEYISIGKEAEKHDLLNIEENMHKCGKGNPKIELKNDTAGCQQRNTISLQITTVNEIFKKKGENKTMFLV
jgi:hypothetical protein